MKQQAYLVWITGLSGSGKTTIGKELYKELKNSLNNKVVFLDGDMFRDIIGDDLGHTLVDRLKNAKRISRMCEFLVSQDINVICSTMSLYSEIHQMNRDNIEKYYEVFIDCNIDELVRRDQKGIYSKAIKGKLDDVVGINLSYDEPNNCHLIIENSKKENLSLKVKEILNLIS